MKFVLRFFNWLRAGKAKKGGLEMRIKTENILKEFYLKNKAQITESARSISAANNEG